MTSALRNRIKGHRRVRAGDLVPHELNFRTHPDRQKTALLDLYEDIGFARSLLAYELPDGRLKLIDGHLRRDLTPDELVDVEVLDVDDDEAMTLLLSMDPLAAEAGTSAARHAELMAAARTNSAALQAIWKDAGRARKALREDLGSRPVTSGPGRFMIVIECNDEPHQAELLERFQQDGLRCRALVG